MLKIVDTIVRPRAFAEFSSFFRSRNLLGGPSDNCPQAAPEGHVHGHGLHKADMMMISISAGMWQEKRRFGVAASCLRHRGKLGVASA